LAVGSRQPAVLGVIPKINYGAVTTKDFSAGLEVISKPELKG
jgi:hypothetical protein